MCQMEESVSFSLSHSSVVCGKTTDTHTVSFETSKGHMNIHTMTFDPNI